MIRTRISLSDEEYRAVKREAARLGISLAQLLRRSLQAVLPVDYSSPWMHYSSPWMHYAGMIQSGDPQSSQRIDEIVYG